MPRTMTLAATLMLVFTCAFADQFEVDELYARVMKAQGPERAQLEAQLDKACAQKDCRMTRLFWYTDLAEAERVASQLGRPVISLHLLGRLDEELSCANSRFFRTTLYSDPAIAALLRDEFVLHWHSVRPVPRITIDFGDGRKIQQTITGNSAHYLLASNGVVLDALPGLHSPNAFREQLERWVRLHQLLRQGDVAGVLARYHADAFNEATQHWRELSARSGVVIEKRKLTKTQIDSIALVASRQAASKARVERPMFAQLEFGQSLTTLQPTQWEKLGAMEQDRVTFAPESIDVIRRKQFGDDAPHTEEMNTLMENLRRTVAAETIFNEIELHRQIHSWFLNGEVEDLLSLNERIYDELFLTPSKDPWLGLRTPSVFTALNQ
ncbi:MAG TPA: hypothetical protein VMU84_18350 [Thermoanaerobaculia bacterium]|nr:hypothetical protein [Thermoanaerobaculia bacterium]